MNSMSKKNTWFRPGLPFKQLPLFTALLILRSTRPVVPHLDFLTEKGVILDLLRQGEDNWNVIDIDSTQVHARR